MSQKAEQPTTDDFQGNLSSLFTSLMVTKSRRPTMIPSANVMQSFHTDADDMAVRPEGDHQQRPSRYKPYSGLDHALLQKTSTTFLRRARKISTPICTNYSMQTVLEALQSLPPNAAQAPKDR